MGFFSWKCSITNKSILAPQAGGAESRSNATLFLPNGEKISGVYNGYGEISGVDIYQQIGKFYFNDPECEREKVFSSKKYITNPDGKEFTIEQFMWDEKRVELDGMSMNEARSAKWQIDTDFNRISKLIKICLTHAVKPKHNYENLKTSEDDENQGFFAG